jgi:ATP-dependent RNA helicase TDRD9
MDDTDTLMDDFFNLGSPPKRKYEAPKPSIEPKLKKIKTEELIDHKRDELGNEYAEKYQEKELTRLAAQSLNMPSTSQAAENVNDEIVSLKTEEPDVPELSFFMRYRFDLKPQVLPILHKRDEILKTVNDNMVTVLTASTGTGKSSQVPQYILEEAHKRKQSCNIVVTQPKRLAG